jgi:hypothetical protein
MSESKVGYQAVRSARSRKDDGKQNLRTESYDDAKLNWRTES